jgi:hypothetical protein
VSKGPSRTISCQIRENLLFRGRWSHFYLPRDQFLYISRDIGHGDEKVLRSQKGLNLEGIMKALKTAVCFPAPIPSFFEPERWEKRPML